MVQQFISTEKVAARYGVHRSTLWRWMQADPTFPRPLMLSQGCMRWRLTDLEVWETTKAVRDPPQSG